MKTLGRFGTVDNVERVYEQAREWAGPDGDITPAEFVGGPTPDWQVVAIRSTGERARLVFYRP